MRSTSQQLWQRGQRDDFTLPEVLHVLWGRRMLVLGAVLVLVLASLIFSMLRETVYEAEAVVRVVPHGSLSAGQDTETFLEEVVGAVNTQDLRQEAVRRSDWQGGEQQFRQQLNIQTFVRQDSEEFGLLVRLAAPDAEAASRGANAYATLFVERVDELNDRLAGGSLAADASLQNQAAAPDNPSSPRPLLYTLIAGGVGLLIGGSGALLLESRTRDWRGARDAELTLRAPVLGVIPEYYPEEGEV